jgi:allantoin racemase
MTVHTQPMSVPPPDSRAANGRSKYRFLLMLPYRLKTNSKWTYQTVGSASALPKEERLKNYELVAPFLQDVDWELDEGSEPPYGDWPVETREEFALAAGARLPRVREACETGRYNALVLLGGGEPGYLEAREICHGYGIVCTANGHSQMHVAVMLGARFSVLDIAGVHNVVFRDVIYRHCMQERCASIRHIGLRLPRPGLENAPNMGDERDKAVRGERSFVVENAIAQAEAAILEDGAEVIIFGCSGVYWLQPFVKKGLAERGWDVPVLEGYSASIEHAKMLVNLGITASGITFMANHPKRLPAKIIP